MHAMLQLSVYLCSSRYYCAESIMVRPDVPQRLSSIVNDIRSEITVNYYYREDCAYDHICFHTFIHLCTR